MSSSNWRLFYLLKNYVQNSSPQKRKKALSWSCNLKGTSCVKIQKEEKFPLWDGYDYWGLIIQWMVSFVPW